MMGRQSSFGDTRRRRRRLLCWRVIRTLLLVVTVTTVGGYAYRVGVSADQARTAKLEADLVRFQQSNLDLRDQLALSTQRSGRAESALDELRRRYAENVPSGELAELSGLVEAQLRAGVDPERLAFLIDAAAQPEDCDGEPVVKRFMPRTPISTGPVSYVRFDDRVIVTGTGESVRSADGLPEAWFDPALPVRIDFQTPDGEVMSVAGVVPLTHSMVIDQREYRFSVVAGERRFVEVAAQACALPQAGGPDDAGAGDFGATGRIDRDPADATSGENQIAVGDEGVEIRRRDADRPNG